MTTDLRLQQLTDWIHKDWPNATIEVASADASFRRYFRINNDGKTSIAMDAPPEHEDCTTFVDVTQRLRKANVHAPEILKQSLEQGFLLLEDLGNTPYLDELNENSVDAMYTAALQSLVSIQSADSEGLPEYNEALLQQEMQLMPEWFLNTHLGISPDEKQQKIINRTLAVITALVLQQPQVFVHRDYHSRNLMVTANIDDSGKNKHMPGVIDYQDAVLGPITYDLVSILRDCYISWPLEQVETWALKFKGQAESAGLLDHTKDETFIQWFDLMGLQRHIKVLGIFARLKHRDGKSNYLDDLPLTLSYVMSVGEKYPLIKPLIDLFREWEIPQKIGTVALSK